MKSWQEIETYADKNGHIPEEIYSEHASQFPTCPPQTPEATRFEAEIWEEYLSKGRRRDKEQLNYQEMYRWEWYEGRKRRGFWGNIEDAIKRLGPGQAPKITIFSAGSGRDVLKVGLAAGIWESLAPKGIKGTYKEISTDYFRLAKPEARIMATEYDKNNYSALKKIIRQLLEKGLLERDMITTRRWNFRETAPVASRSQDIAVFSLTGNYATIKEQPLILKEIVRCLKKGGHLIASCMAPGLNFNKARSPLNTIRLVLTNPLGWPMLHEFAPWQRNWGKMAGMMMEKGYWQNTTAAEWADFLAPAGMETVNIYPGPNKLLPVEVLVSKKSR